MRKAANGLTAFGHWLYFGAGPQLSQLAGNHAIAGPETIGDDDQFTIANPQLDQSWLDLVAWAHDEQRASLARTMMIATTDALLRQDEARKLLRSTTGPLPLGA